MTIATSDIPNILIERIEGAYPGPALFSARETGDWPAEVLDILLYCDVLRSAVRANSSWCPGCEWQCHKPVVSRTNTVHLETRAFIICDEEPGLGRISIPAPSLVQYEATLSAVCGFIAGRMALGTQRHPRLGPHSCWGQSRGGTALVRLPWAPTAAGSCSEWGDNKNHWPRRCSGTGPVFRSIEPLSDGWQIARVPHHHCACLDHQTGRHSKRGCAIPAPGTRPSTRRQAGGALPARATGPPSPQPSRRPTCTT